MLTLKYRPFKHDDWGMIRNEDGSLFATVRRPCGEEELAEHRANGTDPFEEIALKLIAALTRPTPVAPPADATDEMVDAALAVDWENEDERATVHNIWHAMTAHLPTPVAPVSPDTDGKCGELVTEKEAFADAFPQPSRKVGGDPCGECRLQPGETCDICGANADHADDLTVDCFAIAIETVEYQFKPGGNDYWANTTAHNLPGYKAKGWQTRELITRSQAVELLAAERAEKERLRGLLTSAAYDLARANDECVALTIDNAAQAARINELELQLSVSKETAKIKRVEYLDLDQYHSELKVDYAVSEAQLKAAKKALEPFADHANDRAVDDTGWRDKETVKIVVSIGDLRKARAVLGGKPS